MSELGQRRVVIVGGGMAGLVCAAELAHRGLQVVLLERGPAMGGKLRQEQVEGHGIDVGPTVLTMRWALDAVFADLGTRLEEHLRLVPAETLARHAWQDGARLDLFADLERSAAAIADQFGPAEADGFRRYCAHAQGIYQTTEQPFILSPRPGLRSVAQQMGPSGLLRLRRIDLLRTMWKSLASFFGSPHLRQLFARYATYYGSSPMLAPATLNLIAHVELQGVWLPEGGMVRLPQTIVRLATERGAEIRCDAEVAQILFDSGRASGVRLADGETIPADAVVVNADVAALAAGLFGQVPAAHYVSPAPAERSLSAVTLAMRATTSGVPLVRHNVYFSDDYRDEFECIFGRRKLPRQPTVYVCAQDRDDLATAHVGPERLFIILNAPADGGTKALGQDEIDACTDAAFGVLARCGLEVERDPACTVVTTPSDFERRYPATGGALYGLATHSALGPLRRSAGRSPLRGLYLAGGSVHPGAGVPMVTLSGRVAASAVLEDLGSTGLPPIDRAGDGPVAESL